MFCKNHPLQIIPFRCASETWIDLQPMQSTSIFRIRKDCSRHTVEHHLTVTLLIRPLSHFLVNAVRWAGLTGFHCIFPEQTAPFHIIPIFSNVIARPPFYSASDLLLHKLLSKPSSFCSFEKLKVNYSFPCRALPSLPLCISCTPLITFFFVSDFLPSPLFITNILTVYFCKHYLYTIFQSYA